MKKLRASKIHKCNKCLLDYLQKEEEQSESTQALLGTIIHEHIIDHIEKWEDIKIIDREKELENDLFTGHIDGFIKEQNAVFELKTVQIYLS